MKTKAAPQAWRLNYTGCVVLLILLLSGCEDSGLPETVVYKTIDDTTLSLHVFDYNKESPPTAAIIFFFGGGWAGGSVEQFYPQCRYCAARGMVAISAEYRTKSTHGTTPLDSVADAKSAVRWVRQHAAELRVDPNMITASGGSAGGHLAACTAMVPEFDDKNEDQRISSVPNALVLFNPALDTAEERPGTEKISPLKYVRQGICPTIIYHGTADETVSFESVERFCESMNAAGNDCTLVPFEGMEHGFFNHGEHDNEPFEDTMKLTDEFLRRLGFCTEYHEFI